MPKKRIIASLIIKNNIVVQSIAFNQYLPVGKPGVAAKFFNDWGVDELILLDIDASRENRMIKPELIKEVSDNCFVPLTVGGGIKSVDNIRLALQSGADKVSINYSAFNEPDLIKNASLVFGEQCIVISIDTKINAEEYEVFLNNGTFNTGLNIKDYTKKVVNEGAGEIIVNSINRDGSKLGFDINLINSIPSDVIVPVTVIGGAGSPEHFLEVCKLPNVSGVAAANYFHFSEHSIAILKSYLADQGADVRLDSLAIYNNRNIDVNGRLLKYDEDYLEEQIFEYIEEEKI